MTIVCSVCGAEWETELCASFIKAGAKCPRIEMSGKVVWRCNGIIKEKAKEKEHEVKSLQKQIARCTEETFKWYRDTSDSEPTEAFIARMKKNYGEEVVAVVALDWPQVYGEPKE